MKTEIDAQFPPRNAGVVRRNWRVLLRVFFASIWSVDAYFKWIFVFQGESLANMISAAAQGQPYFAQQWIDYWARLSASIGNFTLLIAVTETIFAAFLFLGLLTPTISTIGIIFNMILWSTAEGFGGIFQSGATDIGTAPLYAAIFAGLIIIHAGREKGIDAMLEKRFPRLPFW